MGLLRQKPGCPHLSMDSICPLFWLLRSQSSHEKPERFLEGQPSPVLTDVGDGPPGPCLHVLLSLDLWVLSLALKSWFYRLATCWRCYRLPALLPSRGAGPTQLEASHPGAAM